MFISVLLFDLRPCQMGFKGKGGSHKQYIQRNLPDKHNEDKDNEHTWSVTLTDGLSRNHVQTRTL